MEGAVSDDVYEFVAGYIAEHGYSPSFRDVQAGCGIRSLNTTRARLAALRDAGMIDYADGRARTITLKGGAHGGA